MRTMVLEYLYTNIYLNKITQFSWPILDTLQKKTIKLPWHISYVLVLDDIKSYWLVVSTPLKNMSSLVGMIFPN